MPTYFKPLRRKIGVMTLLMACVFLGGWARSLSRLDYLRLDLGQSGIFLFVSQGRLIGLHYLIPNSASDQPFLIWGSGESSGQTNLIQDDSIGWTIRWYGFAFAKPQFTVWNTEKASYIILPYWSIILPLTLLSTWLLLGRTRAPKPDSVIECHAPKIDR